MSRVRDAELDTTRGPLTGPLSAAQQAIWTHGQLFPGSTTFHLAYAIEILGSFQPELWRDAALRLAVDQPAQRTRIVVGHDGNPHQVVVDEVDERLCVIADARGLSEAELDHRLREEADRPFDLTEGPLYRAIILHVADDRYVLLAQSHHIVADQWSLGLWLDAVGRMHAEAVGWPAKSPRAPRRSPIELAEKEVAWLASDDATADLEFWLDRWRQESRVDISLPGGDLAAPEDHQVQVNDSLDAGATTRLTELAAANGAALSDLLLAAIAVVMGRYGATDSLAVGVLRARRGLANARTMGMFVNEVLVWLSSCDDETVLDVARRTGAQALEAGERDRVPAMEIAAALRTEQGPAIGERSLFDVQYGWQESAGGSDGSLISALSIDGLRHEAEVHGLQMASRGLIERSPTPDHRSDSNDAPHAPLPVMPTASPVSVFGAVVGGQLRVAVRCQRRVAGPWFTERMAGHLISVLNQVADSPESTVGGIDLFDADQRAEIDRLSAGPERSTPIRTVIDGVLERIEVQSERDAVRGPGGSYTYGELGRRIDDLAARLLDAGVGRGDTVGIHLGRTIDLPAAILAVLRCGAAYVPADIRHPAERIAQTFDDAEVRAVLTNRPDVMAPGGPTEIVLPIDDPGPSGRDVGMALDLAERPEPDDTAYILYTSGSTGRPKGVRLTNANLVNLLSSLAERPGFDEDDRILAIATIAFDISFVELILPLWVGGSVEVVDADAVLDGDTLSRLVDETGITVLQATPTTWQLLQSADWAGAPDVRLWSTGEALSRALADWLLSRCAGLWNLFGPTETHVCSVAEVAPGTGAISIGSPVANTVVEVVGAELRPVPLGVRGQLLVGGAAVANGYHARPELTAERFIERHGRPVHLTGDHVSLGPDGQLAYHGRLDNQVKVRGHRVELGEIEAAATDHPAVGAAAVALHEVSAGDSRLALYVVPVAGADAVDPDEIHRFLTGRLPLYMLPSAVLTLDELPQLASRKLDRRGLPVPTRWSSRARTGIVAPRTATERMLVRIWGDVLGLAEVGIEDGFFELGGHSLLATKIASRVRQLLGVELQLSALYQFPTVAKLAPIVDEAERVPAHIIEPIDRTGPMPLTYSQERIWFLQQFLPLGSAYNMPAAVRITGSFDADILQAVLDELAKRQEVLRTRFVSIESRPQQVIEASSEQTLDIIDHTADAARDRAEVEARVEAMLIAEAARPFRLDTLPLFRTVLHRLADDEHILFLNKHHILGDEWSFGVLFSELMVRYRARLRQADGLDVDPALELEELPVQCVDYAAWQRHRLESGDLDGQLDYWRHQLADLPSIELPLDRPRPPMLSGKGASVEVELPEELYGAVTDLARRLMTSPFVIMFAAFDALLHRYTGAEDIVVGCPVANRNTVESEQLVASLVNSLVLRVGVDSERTFSGLVEGAHQTAMAAFANQDVPFEKLVEDLRPSRDPSRSPLFQVFFNMLNAPYDLPTLPGCEMSFEQIERGASQFDLTMTVHPRLGSLRLEYSVDLFDHDRIERMAEHYLRLLTDAVEHPEQSIGDLAMIGPAERSALAEVWGHLDIQPFDDASVLHDLVRSQAEATPDRRAVSSGDRVLTYKELDREADELSRRLLAGGVQPGDAVGVLVERSVWSAVAMVGANRAGAAFVPLDPQMPAERLRYMIRDSGSRCLVTFGDVGSLVEECRAAENGAPLPMIVLDQDAPEFADATPPSARSTANDLAWIIYTSGSTGRPKGCEITHRSAINLFRSWAERPGIGPDDVVMSVTPASFDPSIQDTYLAMLNGAEVHIAPFEATIDGARLAALIDRHRATQMFSTPATWRMLVDSGWEGSVGFMAQSGGEPLPRDLADALLDRVDSVWILYGLTETTIWSSAAPVEAGAGPVFVGPPVANTSFQIIGTGGNAAGIGLPGELCIGGLGLGRGFRNRVELEAERFIENPSQDGPHRRLYRTGDIASYDLDGRLRIHGRSDGQVKLRGRRVDVAEIEAALRSLTELRDAAVLPTEHVGETKVIAFVVPRGDPAELDEDDLMDELRRRLPSYMLPAGFVSLASLPTNPNGKVDRQALVVPDQSMWRTRADEPPANDLERSLASLWERHLDVEGVGRRDDFFELGGNSLQAAALFADITELTGREYPISALFQGPTVADLARVVGVDWQPASTSLIPVNPSGSERPFFSVSPFLISTLSYRLLADCLGPDQPLYAVQPQGLDGVASVHKSIDEMADHYIQEIRKVQGSGPYRIGGHCAGNWVAFEMGLRLQAAGEEVESLVLVDWGPPGSHRRPSRDPMTLLNTLRSYRASGRLGQSIAWQAGLVGRQLRGLWTRNEGDRRLAQVHKQHLIAHSRYEPTARFAGDVMLLRSTESIGRRDRDWHLRWQDLVDGSVEIREVPGTHAQLLLEPDHTRVMAEHLLALFNPMNA